MFIDEQKNEIDEKLKKTRANHEKYIFIVSAFVFILLGLAERFPNAQWASIGVFCAIIVYALGFILR